MLFVLAGCLTVGYHYAKDPLMVATFDVTVLAVRPQKIRDGIAVAWIGPLAPAQTVGWRVQFVDATGKTSSIVQPMSDKYELTPGQRAVYVVYRGQVWVQPTDFPLPREFDSLEPAGTPLTGLNGSPLVGDASLIPMATTFGSNFAPLTGPPELDIEVSKILENRIDGDTVDWTDPVPGDVGSIALLSTTYSSLYTRCRALVMSARGRNEALTACRDASGNWTWSE